MPEEFEEQEVTVAPEVEAPPEVEAEEEAKVPIRVVKELRDELRELKSSDRAKSEQISGLISEIQNARKENRPIEPQPDLDPEVLKLLKPYLKPFEEEIGRTKAELATFKASREQSEAERYIEKSLPNLEEIRTDLLKEIQSYSKEEQNEILANPREIVRIGKMISRLKSGTSTVKTENRSRARAETGTTQTTRESNRIATADDASFNKFLRDNGYL
jgi:hypothetical protein